MGQELLIELVSDCNLRCKMCAFKSGFTHKRMNNQIVKQIFQGIAEVNNCNGAYHFTDLRMDGNSEPLLYPDLPYVIQCANEAGIENVNITTNGVLLTHTVTDRLLESNLTTIDISMTGILPEIYREFQGYGLSQDALARQIEIIKENVRYFVEQKKKRQCNIVLTMRYIITDQTKSHFLDYIDCWRSIGVDAVMGMTLTETELRGKCSPKGEIMKYKSCESPEHPVICANGDVLMSFCPYDVPVIGNFHEHSIQEIFLSPENQNRLWAFRSATITGIPENCRNCHNTHIYRGGKW